MGLDTDPTYNDEIKATCTPDGDLEGLCTFSLETIRDGKIIATLTAARYADWSFDFIGEGLDHLLHAFDSHSADAYGLAKDVIDHSDDISEILGEEPNSGFLGILRIAVNPEVRGQGLSKRLVEYLRELHQGMVWNVGLQAVPSEFLEGPKGVLEAMRSRLIEHYRSMGFGQVAPETCPHLMVDLWE